MALKLTVTAESVSNADYLNLDDAEKLLQSHSIWQHRNPLGLIDYGIPNADTFSNRKLHLQ
jgi:hypothetical protein